MPSPDRIVLLRDAGNGQVTKTTFLENLHSPFGMALVGNDFYVANTDAVARFAYTEGATHIKAPGEKVADLPAGPINHHWTKNLIASKDGSKLYVTVGSNSNVAETASTRREFGPQSFRSTASRESGGSLHQASATRTAWAGDPRQASYGPLRMSVMNSVATLFLTT